MSVTVLPRSQSAREIYAKAIPGLIENILRSKRLRGERMQVESVLESLGAPLQGETPQEQQDNLQQRLIGGLKATREKARKPNVLANILDTFNPATPSFAGPTRIEDLLAGQGLKRALEDPMAIATREANLRAAEARTDPLAREQREKNLESTQSLIEARNRISPSTVAEKGFTSDQIKRFNSSIVTHIDTVKGGFSPGKKSRTQKEFLGAWENFKADPAVGFEQLNITQQRELWQVWNSGIVGKKKAEGRGSEIQWDPTSAEVQAATPGAPSAKAKSIITGKILPAGVTFPQLAEMAAGLDVESRLEFIEINNLFIDAQNSGDPEQVEQATALLQEAIRRIRNLEPKEGDVK